MHREKLGEARPLRSTGPNGIIFVPEGRAHRLDHSVRLVVLKTLGHPALHRADGALVEGLRRKDLALLVYLCVEGLPGHARGRLAALLWGESPEERARHSLTQALGRLSRAVPSGALAPDKDAVRWTGTLPCDAGLLLRDGMEPEEVDDAFTLYAGHFLEGFDPGAGAQDFREWADRRRAELRNAALRLLDRAGGEAEGAGDFARALRLGERAVEIDPVWEQGHRRVMRALAARGERNGALRHYQRLQTYLDEEVGGQPDPDTRALAGHIRAPAPDSEPAPLPPPRADRDPAASPTLEPPRSVAPQSAEPTSDAAPPESPSVKARSVNAERASESETARAADEDRDSPVPVAPPLPPNGMMGGAAKDADVRLPWMLVMDRISLWLAVILACLVLVLAIHHAEERSAAPPTLPEAPPAHGENVRLRGSRSIYLVFGETLYEYPDSSTLSACTGRHPEVVREVRALPPWPSRRLPSVLRHAWMGGHLPIVSDHPRNKTAYVPVGCIAPGVPGPATLDSIFGSGTLGRMLEVPDSVLQRLPRAFVAHGHPLRPAGTLIRSPDGRIRWVTYHGGSLDVPDPGVLAAYCRSVDEVVAVSAAEFAYYKPWSWLRPRERGCPRHVSAR